MSAECIGRVAALWRYPVKSMAAESLAVADVSWAGIDGDRRWAFVQDALVRSDFPWFTIRERSDMGRFVPRIVDSTVVVTTPDGHELDVADPALAAELGDGIRPIKQGRGTFDAMPLSLLTTRSVAALGESVGRELDPRRFRPNILVESGALEHEFVGCVLQVGDMRMRVDQRDSRCVIVNVDPETSERDARVLKTIARERGSCTGVYGSTVEPGRVALGDPVAVEA
jgi:uncharacterized protein YcbX